MKQSVIAVTFLTMHLLYMHWTLLWLNINEMATMAAALVMFKTNDRSGFRSLKIHKIATTKNPRQVQIISNIIAIDVCMPVLFIFVCELFHLVVYHSTFLCLSFICFSFCFHDSLFIVNYFFLLSYFNSVEYDLINYKC